MSLVLATDSGVDILQFEGLSKVNFPCDMLVTFTYCYLLFKNEVLPNPLTIYITKISKYNLFYNAFKLIRNHPLHRKT